MAPFDDYFRQVSAELAAAYEDADGFDHESDARDAFVEQFLEETFPSEYLHVGGTIVDANGESSNRAGIVLYDPFVPVLGTDGRDQYLSAGVHAHIDVRADLFGEIDHALSKGDSIKRLDVERAPVDGDTTKRKTLFSTIVAFEGPAPETFKETVLAHYANRNSLESCVDVICVVGEYVMVTRHSGRDAGLSFLMTEDDSLMVFLLNLASAVSTNDQQRRPILSAYLDRNEVPQF